MHCSFREKRIILVETSLSREQYQNVRGINVDEIASRRLHLLSFFSFSFFSKCSFIRYIVLLSANQTAFKTTSLLHVFVTRHLSFSKITFVSILTLHLTRGIYYQYISTHAHTHTLIHTQIDGETDGHIETTIVGIGF